MSFRVKGDLASALTGTWQTDLVSTPCKAPLTCCHSFCCTPCLTYGQRAEFLDVTQEPYVCCGGVCPCPCLTEPCDSRVPWLAFESCCCTTMAIQVNRVLIQTRFNIRNDPFDDGIIAALACCDLVSPLVEMCLDRSAAEHLEHFVRLIETIVCSCMLAQQEVQMKSIRRSLASEPYRGIPPTIMAQLPPRQQTMLRSPQRPPSHDARSVPLTNDVSEDETPTPVTSGQILLTVPSGLEPGQTMEFTTPDGRLMQARVPAGLTTGKQFMAAF